MDSGTENAVQLTPPNTTVEEAAATTVEAGVEEDTAEMPLQTTTDEDAQVAPSELENNAEEAEKSLPDGTSADEVTETTPLESTAEDKEPAKPPPKPQCGICKEEDGKYKCPRCQLPYCSVVCFRTHKENHPPDPAKPVPASSSAAAPETTVDQNKPRKRKHPFSVLEDCPELDRLFKKYPFLPARLNRIHAATLQPKDEQQQLGRGGLPWNLSQIPGEQSKKPKWSHDTGLKRGKRALRKARCDPSEVGDAVREYCELVLFLLAPEKNMDGDATDIVRNQVTQMDVKLIESLIEEEGMDRD